jgi:hypothetical protein
MLFVATWAATQNENWVALLDCRSLVRGLLSCSIRCASQQANSTHGLMSSDNGIFFLILAFLGSSNYLLSFGIVFGLVICMLLFKRETPLEPPSLSLA